MSSVALWDSAILIRYYEIRHQYDVYANYATSLKNGRYSSVERQIKQ